MKGLASIRDIDQWTPIYADGNTIWIDGDGKQRAFPKFSEIKSLIDAAPKMPSVDKLIYEPARRIVHELEGKGIPAKDLTNKQKCAIFTLAGFMKFENGRMVSIRPVGISDDGNGGYFVGIAPEKP